MATKKIAPKKKPKSMDDQILEGDDNLHGPYRSFEDPEKSYNYTRPMKMYPGTPLKKGGSISQASKDKKTFQNDRTKPLPKEAYTQDDQELRYDADTSTEGSFSHGGEVRGGGAAIRGKGFKGVF
jgi:hypothetical protein